MIIAGLFALDRAIPTTRVLAIQPLEPRFPMTAAAGLVGGGAQPTGELAGKIVYTTGGHGWQWSNTLNRFATDRGNLLDVVEDFGNQDQMTRYVDYVFRAGATVVPLRPVGRQINEVVLDNDSPGVTFSGSWGNNTAGPRWYDEDYGAVVDPIKYRFASVNATAETATATYTPNIPAAGQYPVYAWTSSSSNRTVQSYRINHSSGETTVRVDHRLVGNGWVYLGTYHFDNGSSAARGSVQISNRSSGGGSVVIADAIRFGNGMGDVPWGPGGIGTGSISGYPREDENSLMWAWRSVGQGVTPASIVGTNNVPAPIRMAAEMNTNSTPYGTSVFVSFHSNATTGNPATATARGAIGLIHSSSPTPNQDDLATFLGRQVNTDMRALDGQFEFDWSTRTSNTLAGAFGEMSNAWAQGEMDAVISEVAFHDNIEDTALLRDPKVRDQLARSSYEATLEHFFTHSATTRRPANVALPSPPQVISAVAGGNGQVTLRWTAGPSSTGGFSGVFGSPATSFRVYASINGRSFDAGTVVPGGGSNTVTLSGYDPSRPYYFKVVAENSGGQSMPSEVLTAMPASGDRQVLVVSGFDRLDKSQNFKQPYPFTSGATTTDRVWQDYNNSRDYTIEVQSAIQAARPGVRVDSASNEAIIDGAVSLDDYEAVVWISGTESSADSSFTATEQSRITQYIAAGGNVLVTGAEIGFELDGLNRGRSFYRNVLGATYVSDDAATHNVAPLGTGIFAGVSGISFSSGTAYSQLDNQKYNVAFPDVLSPAAGAIASLQYSGGTGGVAAIQKTGSGTAGNTVVFGFPFETITNPSTRSAIMDRVLGFFDVNVPVVAVAPRVTGVIIASSTWTPLLIDAVDGGGVGTGNGLGLSLAGPTQLTNVSWSGIDRIYISFDKNVESTFTASNIRLTGTRIANYLSGATIGFGASGFNVGTITLAAPIAADALVLSLSPAITDSSGAGLDGEWTDSVSLVSGNGTPGGQFNFRIDVLPGDVDDSGGVNVDDVLAVNTRRGRLTTDLAIARFDVNGSGGINVDDVLSVNTRRGTILPTAPTPPTLTAPLLTAPQLTAPLLTAPVSTSRLQLAGRGIGLPPLASDSKVSIPISTEDSSSSSHLSGGPWFRRLSGWVSRISLRRVSRFS